MYLIEEKKNSTMYHKQNIIFHRKKNPSNKFPNEKNVDKLNLSIKKLLVYLVFIDKCKSLI